MQTKQNDLPLDIIDKNISDCCLGGIPFEPIPLSQYPWANTLFYNIMSLCWPNTHGATRSVKENCLWEPPHSAFTRYNVANNKIKNSLSNTMFAECLVFVNTLQLESRSCLFSSHCLSVLLLSISLTLYKDWENTLWVSQREWLSLHALWLQRVLYVPVCGVLHGWR